MLDKIYKKLSQRSGYALRAYLKYRVKMGKEDPARVQERYGISTSPRPDKEKLIWIHAASVGEAQSALILMKSLSKKTMTLPFFLVTTGTLTSARLMKERLPDNALHHYAVLDHPDWVRAFFDHWRPDIALWMESELWPNTLRFLKKRHIPSALVNGRMSEKSFKNWKRSPRSARSLLESFDTILCQSDMHKTYFDALGAPHTLVTDNLKYSATALPYDAFALKALKKEIKKRPVWLYASTHAGEETLACETHLKLKETYPDLLTLIVPRHPDRRDDILKSCASYDVSIALRSQMKGRAQEIEKKTDIYIADTLGELGLFYALSEIAVIGRSLSDDGGGGHNPIEAALLDCAILTGPHIQNQQALFESMNEAHAVEIIPRKEDLSTYIHTLLEDTEKRTRLMQRAKKYASQKAGVIDHVMEELEPLFLKAGIVYK